MTALDLHVSPLGRVEGDLDVRREAQPRGRLLQEAVDRRRRE